MPSRTELIAALLLIDQHRIDPATDSGPHWPPSDPATGAAAALAAGEARRARRLLRAAAPDEVSALVAHAVETFDRQWAPGGTGSLPAASAGAAPGWTDVGPAARAHPLGVLATRMLPELLSCRVMAEDERRAGLAQFAGGARRRFTAAAEDWNALGPAARSFVALARADLAQRDGDVRAAAAAAEQAAALADGDAAAQAHLDLVRGDWLAEPGRHPESLGLSFGARPTGDLPADETGAAECYARADRRWSAIGSRAGQAAVALRLAQLARRRNRPEERDRQLADAVRHAAAAGQRALLMLATVHGLIDAITDGRPPAGGAMDRVTGWVRDDGGVAYGRGLTRLLVVRARLWRDEGDFGRARTTIGLAGSLAEGTGERIDGSSISIDRAAVYGGVNFRKAQLVYSDIEAAEGITRAGDRPVGALDWVALAIRCLELFREANVVADPRLIAVAAGRLRSVLSCSLRPAPDHVDAFSTTYRDLTSALRQAQPAIDWYEAQDLRDRGLEADAVAAFDQALAGTAREDVLLRCAILASVPRRAEAFELAVGFCTEVHPQQATAVFLRLEEPDFAELFIGQVPADTDPPWTVPALYAALYRLRGDAAQQVREAGRAVAAFEGRQSRLARDVLRSAATDDLVVAEAYRDLITGQLALGRPDGIFAALAASDRARGLTALVLSDLAGLAPAARSSVRAWLAANSRWAGVYERAAAGLTGIGPAPTERRGELDEAESILDEAEEQVRRLAPELLRARVAPPPDLLATAKRLPAEAVLLAYHHFRGEVIGWAVTADGAAECTGPVRDRGLAGAAARWHAALSRKRTDPEAAGLLADRLLEPFRSLLTDDRPIVVVPHRDLSTVPFHALPFDGEVLGTEHDVSYLPAVSLLSRPGLGRAVDLTRGALLVGDPEFSPGTGMRRLPGTRREVLAAREALPGATTLLGPQATAADVIALAPGRAIVHLGSHAVVQPGLPNLAFVALAGAGRLGVGDLVGLDLSADLLVLSACQTGAGTSTHGGDVVGLARAALIAGAANVVVSLWPVDDAVGALVMARFYGYLSRRWRVARALAQAQRDVRALSPEKLAGEYGELAGNRGEPIPRGVRDADGDDTSEPDATFGWAPFIHVGIGG